MKEAIRFRPIFLFSSLVYLLAFCFFYFKYVPIVKSFQMILVPLLFMILIITSMNIKWGILFFVFAFPLVNNLPYFFKIDESIPHAPTALVLFLVFFLGWLLHNSFHSSISRFNHPVFKPIILFSIIIFVSFVITLFRYANFFPFLSDKIYELIVNVRGVSAGGAIMSDVFNVLNYLTGFLFFFILFNTLNSKEFMKKILIVLSFSALISLLFSLVQRFYSIGFGNTQFWVKFDRINSTFKDPNSFGVFLSAFLPLAFGMIFSYRRQIKIFLILVTFFALIVFPSIGSRSGLLGLGISSLTFFLLFFISYDVSFKKKIIYGLSIFLIVVLFLFSFCIFSKQTNLYKRVGWSLDMLSGEESLDRFFTRRLNFWAAASNMVIDYPLTGVGLGSFIIELPNYSKQMGFPFEQTDSAENYFFQVGSELGLIGLFLVLWMLWEIIRGTRKNWKNSPSDDKDRFILIGAISGIVAILVNFLLHSYIGSYEVKYFFWLLVALVLIFSKDKIKFLAKIKFGYKFRIIAIILPTFFGIFHLWNSTHSLSISNLTEKFGWNQNFGLYKLEKDNRGFSFQWTKKSAGITVENVGQVLVIPMMASHPDIKKNPVKVKVFLANRYFKKEKLIKEIVLKDNSWIDFEYPISKLSEKKIYLVLDTNRTWQPLKYSGVPDPRWLAIGLGEEWFKYPSKLSKEKIKNIYKISSERWEGEFKKNLISSGISHVKFQVDDKDIAIRLWVKGQKAFNVGPYVIIRLDNQIIGKSQLIEDKWTSLIFTPEISKGEHILSVEFTNDIYIPELKQDRNVFLGDLEVIYMR